MVNDNDRADIVYLSAPAVFPSTASSVSSALNLSVFLKHILNVTLFPRTDVVWKDFILGRHYKHPDVAHESNSYYHSFLRCLLYLLSILCDRRVIITSLLQLDGSGATAITEECGCNRLTRYVYFYISRLRHKSGSVKANWLPLPTQTVACLKCELSTVSGLGRCGRTAVFVVG